METSSIGSLQSRQQHRPPLRLLPVHAFQPYVLGANMEMIDLSDIGKLVSTGQAIDSRECLGAVVSNGRIFYISQASGFVVSQTYGPESQTLPAVWERR